MSNSITKLNNISELIPKNINHDDCFKLLLTGGMYYSAEGLSKKQKETLTLESFLSNNPEYKRKDLISKLKKEKSILTVTNTAVETKGTATFIDVLPSTKILFDSDIACVDRIELILEDFIEFYINYYKVIGSKESFIQLRGCFVISNFDSYYQREVVWVVNFALSGFIERDVSDWSMWFLYGEEEEESRLSEFLKLKTYRYSIRMKSSMTDSILTSAMFSFYVVPFLKNIKDTYTGSVILTLLGNKKVNSIDELPNSNLMHDLCYYLKKKDYNSILSENFYLEFLYSFITIDILEHTSVEEGDIVNFLITRKSENTAVDINPETSFTKMKVDTEKLTVYSKLLLEQIPIEELFFYMVKYNNLGLKVKYKYSHDGYYYLFRNDLIIKGDM